jgi:hypothetical protein
MPNRKRSNMIRPISFPLVQAFVETALEMTGHPDDAIDYVTHKGVVRVTRKGKRFTFNAPYLNAPVTCSGRDLEITLLTVAY